MVRIKFTARPRTPIVSPRFSPMDSETATNTSIEHRESSTEQPNTSFADGQAVSSTEVTSDQDVGFDEENTSRDTDDSGDTSDNGGYVKIGTEAALAGISYDFGLSKVKISRITSLKKSARYFPMGFARAPGMESVPAPQENEAVVFEDFFIDGLRIPPHPVLREILCKFQVQLH
jgi:hypothetical protein